MSKLSIIVTTYNIDKYLPKCLDSICNQTLKDIEVIIVDDGSSDNTRKIIKQYAEKDSRITPILFDKNTVGGVATAANAGLNAAKGDYIGFADGDDWYELDMFEKLYNKAVAVDAEIAFCNYLEYDEVNNVNKEPSDAKKWNDLIKFNGDLEESESFKKLFLRFNPVPWRKIYKRDFIELNHIRFPEGDYFFEDNPFHWENVAKASKFVFENFVGCYHRINRPGQTMGTADRRLLAMYEHHRTIITMLKDADLFEQYKVQCIGWLVGNTSWISEKIDEKLLKQLCNIFAEELKLYPTDFVKNILNTPVVGTRGTELISSAIKNDKKGFALIARHKVHVKKLESAKQGNAFIYLIKLALHTWKTEGTASTLKKVKRFIFHKLKIEEKTEDKNKKMATDKSSNHTNNNAELLKEIKALRTDVNKLNGQLNVIKAALALLNSSKK